MRNEVKGNRRSGDDKGAVEGVDCSMGDVTWDKNNGVRGGKGVKGVGIGETGSGNMADSGIISVATSGNSDKDCVVSNCNTDKVISDG